MENKISRLFADEENQYTKKFAFDSTRLKFSLKTEKYVLDTGPYLFVVVHS